MSLTKTELTYATTAYERKTANSIEASMRELISIVGKPILSQVEQERQAYKDSENFMYVCLNTAAERANRQLNWDKYIVEPEEQLAIVRSIISLDRQGVPYDLPMPVKETTPEPEPKSKPTTAMDTPPVQDTPEVNMVSILTAPPTLRRSRGKCAICSGKTAVFWRLNCRERRCAKCIDELGA